jgi:hypothetical protein
MSETRIRREEIKGIAEQRKCERADAADINEGGSGACNCDDGSCEWHEDD